MPLIWLFGTLIIWLGILSFWWGCSVLIGFSPLSQDQAWAILCVLAPITGIGACVFLVKYG
ncbi:hypothetical protein [Ancylobacter polymorphus]